MEFWQAQPCIFDVIKTGDEIQANRTFGINTKAFGSEYIQAGATLYL